MIQIAFSDSQIKEADKTAIERSNSLKENKVPHYHISDIKPIIGALGETLFRMFYPESGYLDRIKYDFLLKNKTVEVKATEYIYFPNNDFRINVPNFNSESVFDYFLFIGIKKDLAKGILFGYMPKERFIEKSYKIKKGDILLPKKNIAKTDSNCVNLEQVHSLDELILSKKTRVDFPYKRLAYRVRSTSKVYA